MTPSRRLIEVHANLVSKTRYWWVLLITGVAWIGLAAVILRFSYATVAAVSMLFGISCVVAVANELIVGAMSSRGRRTFHWLFAALFVVMVCLAAFLVKETFVILAVLVGVYFAIRGAFDVAMAFAARGESGWVVLLIVGLAELAIGLWTAGSWKVSVVALVARVAIGALVHGVGEIVCAFLAREVRHHDPARR